MRPIPREDITGLILCGGRGTRMGGVDKGLQLHRGLPLVAHALQRLQPQVGRVLINANRHLDTYAALGAPVCPDTLPDYPGPLAGWLAGLAHCHTPYLMAVPCDSPRFPLNLVQRLAATLAAEGPDGADIAMASTLEDGQPQRQPAFCLMKTQLQADLQAALQAGERQVGRWAQRHRCVHALFDDADAFFNANTLADLQHGSL